ncbi:MAG: hypothetical protein KDD94_14480 [Calditrichaeota bacterium]|nr:hypothetical protein [Calditrichota bacterium]
MVTTFISLIFFCSIFSQSIFQNALSPRNANYTINVTLDPQAKTVSGKLQLHCRNISPI